MVQSRDWHERRGAPSRRPPRLRHERRQWPTVASSPPTFDTCPPTHTFATVTNFSWRHLKVYKFIAMF
ncbi:unnamed protein product [Colias eurytheme]|nr:unnamed protein product [Colias eurytheme]